MEAQTERFHCSGGHSAPHGILFIANTNIYICWGAGRLFFYPPFKATVSESEDLPCYPLLLLHRPLWDFRFLFVSDESKIIFIQPQIKRAREEGFFQNVSSTCMAAKLFTLSPPPKKQPVWQDLAEQVVSELLLKGVPSLSYFISHLTLPKMYVSF